MHIDYSIIGKRIKAKRKLSKKTQDNLAESLSVSVGYISQIERGVTKISLDTISEIATCLNCDISELITGIATNSEIYLNNEFNKIYKELTNSQKNLLYEIALIITKH